MISEMPMKDFAIEENIEVSQPKILIVDDTVENVEILERILSDSDYLIYRAYDGLQAMEVINEVILFLEGKQEKVVRELKAKMNRAAEALDFEKASLIRDQIQAIHRVIEGQKIAATVRGELMLLPLPRTETRLMCRCFPFVIIN